MKPWVLYGLQKQVGKEDEYYYSSTGAGMCWKQLYAMYDPMDSEDTTHSQQVEYWANYVPIYVLRIFQEIGLGICGRV